MNLNRIESILRLLHQQGHVGEVDVEGDGWRLKAVRGWIVPEHPPAETPLDEELPQPGRAAVCAGMVGIFRAPETPVRPGDHIAPGTVVGNIDSMRILNPVTAAEGGYVAEVRVEDGDPVEYGQELLILTAERSLEDAGWRDAEER